VAALNDFSIEIFLLVHRVSHFEHYPGVQGKKKIDKTLLQHAVSGGYTQVIRGWWSGYGSR